MKRYIVLATSIILPLIGNADIILNEGESFVFSFGTNDFVYQYDLPELTAPPEWSIYFLGPISTETIFTASLYQDSLTENPFHSRTITNGPSPVIGYVMFEPFDVSYNPSGLIEKWDDAQGLIKLELHQGSAQITEIYAGTIIDNKYYTASIPEPNSVALILVGGGLFYLRKKKNSHWDRTPHR